MAGYCQKDEGQEHYVLDTEGVPDSVLAHGRDIYMAIGPNPERDLTLIKKSHLVVLAQVSSLQQAQKFFGANATQLIAIFRLILQVFFRNFHLADQHPDISIQNWDIKEVVWQMIRSRRYVPHVHWCIPQQGKGMWWGKAQALWRLCTAPDQASMEDVEIVFFDAPEGHVHSSYEAHARR